MTEPEARELRINTAKLHRHIFSTFCSAIDYALNAALKEHGITNPNLHAVQDAVQLAWDKTNLDDAFHALGSQGYRSLITAGWNPIVVNDPNNWQPSPDCIDHPTTRGGAAT